MRERVIDELENIIPGFVVNMATRLDGGTYAMQCGNLQTTAGVLTVSGGLAASAEPNKVVDQAKLDAAREQLTTLRRQQEELERQKSDLEELRRKQEEYARGKTEMIENLTRSLATLEREQIQAQRVAELCDTTTDAFRDYLEQLQSMTVTVADSGDFRSR